MSPRTILLSLFLAALLLPAPFAAAQDAPPCPADAGVVITRSIDSAALGQTMYKCLLPPDWCTSAICRCCSSARYDWRSHRLGSIRGISTRRRRADPGR